MLEMQRLLVKHQCTSEEVSDLLNKIFELLVVVFKVVFLLLGFLQGVHCLVLHILCQRGYILELDTGNQHVTSTETLYTV